MLVLASCLGGLRLVPDGVGSAALCMGFAGSWVHRRWWPLLNSVCDICIDYSLLQALHTEFISSMTRERLRRHLHYWRGAVEARALIFRVLLRYKAGSPTLPRAAQVQVLPPAF